eukprot:CAMPEP_0169288940 /NCGR_PEP_ID=MMETSP1016-20121227/60850_1 /TAXON_ID=342587 /ORGANISM="Karlodinium micrum, Strain CCMP2283" /LENGTH=436 /DNA_ID=CAMNT_0009379249 /DNA_START=26 /DNA_END=1336 /DNA_ORIENTATION=+
MTTVGKIGQASTRRTPLTVLRTSSRPFANSSWQQPSPRSSSAKLESQAVPGQPVEESSISSANTPRTRKRDASPLLSEPLAFSTREASATPRRQTKDTTKYILQQSLLGKNASGDTNLLGQITIDLDGFGSEERPSVVATTTPQPPCTDGTLSEPSPDTMRWLQQLVPHIIEMRDKVISPKFNSLAQVLAESRVDMRRYSDQSCIDLEKRMTMQLLDLERRLLIDSLGNPAHPMHDEKEVACLHDVVRSSAEDGKCGSIEDEPHQHARLIGQISDHVIARVNRDPRICQLIESHRSMRQDLSRLMETTITKPDSRAEKDPLYDAMIETQKSCKSIALEVRQIRQRRNHDWSQAELRFVKLEHQLKAIQGKLASESDVALAGNDSRTMEEMVFSGACAKTDCETKGDTIDLESDGAVEQLVGALRHEYVTEAAMSLN